VLSVFVCVFVQSGLVNLRREGEEEMCVVNSQKLTDYINGDLFGVKDFFMSCLLCSIPYVSIT